MKKWLVKFKGRSIAVGNTIPEAIGEALRVITTK